MIVMAAGLRAGVQADPAPDAVFDNIDGGQLRLSDFAGQVVLVVNTASRCGFAPQFSGLQDLQDNYAGQGFTVLAVPSDDFQQELDSNAEVKSFCAMTFGIEEMPMTTITHVTGERAHPFYRWMREAHAFEPEWNFNKILLDRHGNVVQTYPATAEPLSEWLRGDIEAAIAG
ncbi:hypothetical protein BFP70_16520 [Thioclava sp. SK-1]|nr:hypothetical protein BFP70_16520 [Thioclava sp. SK-1]